PTHTSPLSLHDALPISPAYIKKDADAQAFLPNDPHTLQPNWHFTDIPIGATQWTKGTDDDVVTLIRRCTHVLQDNLDPGEFITKDRKSTRLNSSHLGIS